ncbi:MAG TPA: A/G-specific adenine glycosylase [Longilinea sp.]|nr:A/G-specific adenine glycosylase [Longilinea sp.]
MTHPIVEPLLGWYHANGRTLPWRGYTDPYAVWISEIMLQQTRVDTVIPYFQKWMLTFPTLESLANASQQEVLSVWEGLGYYSRARNLHKTARVIVDSYHGRFPHTPKELSLLPGIGAYTAGAIASIAFGADEPAIDGNVQRIFSRLFDISEPIKSNPAKIRIHDLVKSVLPPGRGSDFNQALMDLANAVCLPKNPHCADCPLKSYCEAYSLGNQEYRPVKADKPPVPTVQVTAAILFDHDRVLITRRPSKGLLGGLWEFPGGKIEPGETQAAAIQREIKEELGIEVQAGVLFGTYHHAYTHFKIELFALECKWISGVPKPLVADEIMWTSVNDLLKFPMGKVDRLISKQLIQQIT